HNFPNTIQLGDVINISSKNLHQIDLLIGGSPCQGFSFAGKQLNFDDPRSKLFFEFIRLKNELNPKYFLLENVIMKKEYQDIISEHMGVQPVKINSANFLPQNRPRLYWTNINIKEIPNNKYKLSDILLDDDFIDLDKFKLSEKGIAYMNRYRKDKVRWEYHKNPLDGNAACLTANMYKGTPYGVIKEKLRRLHPIECERLQGVPDNYTSVVSNTQRYKMLGNGWTVNVIEHIFSSLKIK
ncbi:MAG: DNA cytosine methyltransferase, partial [bacterium]